MTTTPRADGDRIQPWKIVLPIIILLLVVAGVLSVIQRRLSSTTDGATGGAKAADGGAQLEEIRLGGILPDHVLTRLAGGTTPLSGLGAKVTLINFWASWCEACMVEMPSILKLREAYKAKGFEVAAINSDENPRAVVPPLVKKLGLTFPIFTDADGALAEKFDVHAIPFSVLIDRDRKVLMIETGERDWNATDVRAVVEKWTSG